MSNSIDFYNELENKIEGLFEIIKNLKVENSLLKGKNASLLNGVDNNELKNNDNGGVKKTNITGIETETGSEVDGN